MRIDSEYLRAYTQLRVCNSTKICLTPLATGLSSGSTFPINGQQLMMQLDSMTGALGEMSVSPGDSGMEVSGQGAADTQQGSVQKSLVEDKTLTGQIS